MNAALEGDRQAGVKAVAQNSMTSSASILDQVRATVDEMPAAEAASVPQFGNERSRPVEYFTITALYTLCPVPMTVTPEPKSAVSSPT